jgi:hypothetical protein
VLKRYLALAGLPMDLTPHNLRHCSHASSQLRARSPARQELLGHSQLATTHLHAREHGADCRNSTRKAHTQRGAVGDELSSCQRSAFSGQRQGSAGPAIGCQRSALGDRRNSNLFFFLFFVFFFFFSWYPLVQCERS